MIDQPFRSFLGTRVAWLIRGYTVLGLTPNHVTLLGCGFGLLAACAVAANVPYGAIVLWWVGRLLDGTDGIYARSTSQVSDFGGYLDILCDMTAYGAMVIGFYVMRPALGPYWVSILFLYILCITSALSFGGLAEKRHVTSNDNRSLTLASGLAEGGETGICYTLLLLLPQHSAFLCMVWCLVLGVTIVARTMAARRILLP